MGGQPSNLHHSLFQGPKLLPDPGDAGTITATQDLQICEIVSTTAETRTIANPTKPGIRLTVRLLTAGGTVTVTAAAGLNVDLDTTATLADAGDFLSLISVTLVANSTYRWEILEGNVGVTLA